MKPHYQLRLDGNLYLDGVFWGYLKWGGWYDPSGCAFQRYRTPHIDTSRIKIHIPDEQMAKFLCLTTEQVVKMPLNQRARYEHMYDVCAAIVRRLI